MTIFSRCRFHLEMIDKLSQIPSQKLCNDYTLSTLELDKGRSSALLDSHEFLLGYHVANPFVLRAFLLSSD